MDSQIPSDDAFVAFAFSMVTVVVLVVFLPQIFHLVTAACRRTYSKLTGQKPQRRSQEDAQPDPLAEFADFAMFLPRLCSNVIKNISSVVAGAKLLCSSWILFRLFVPKGVAVVVRPKFILLVVWIYLMVSVTYATLAYDPYLVLGLPNTAGLTDVKKAYRSLTRINHPDQNKTQAARVIFAQIRKAYKTLTKGEDDKADDDDQFSVGIALPLFLTNHQNDAAVLWGLLLLLIAVPLGLWYRFGRSPSTKLSSHFATLFGKVRPLDELLDHAGHPAASRFRIRRHELKVLETIMTKVGMQPQPLQMEMAFDDKFPSLAEFKTRCLDPGRYGTALVNMGFGPEVQQKLKSYFESNELPSEPVETKPRNASPSEVEAAHFLFEQWYGATAFSIHEIATCVASMWNVPEVDLNATRKLERLHEDVKSSLNNMAQKRFTTRDNAILADAREKFLEIAKDVPKDCQAKFQQRMKQAYARQ